MALDWEKLAIFNSTCTDNFRAEAQVIRTWYQGKRSEVRGQESEHQQKSIFLIDQKIPTENFMTCGVVHFCKDKESERSCFWICI